MAATEELYQRLVPQAADEDTRAEEPRNFLIHVASLAATKLADGLIDPKLVLTWLMNALGAPAALIGLLVPVREAGALLPQLVLAPKVQAARRKHPFWVAGSAIQGLAALGIGVAALTLEGWTAGWVIVGLLAVLACARAVCSVSYKDALARTVIKRTRGTAKGTAGTVAASLVFAFGALLALGVIPLTTTAIATAILVAGVLWVLGAALFVRLDEPPLDEPSESGFTFAELAEPLREDSHLRTYIATRGLLTATALAPPFIVTLAAVGSERQLGHLGPLVIASGAAAILSSYVWGRLSDRSSRRTLMAGGAAAAVVLGLCAVAGFLTGGIGGTLGATAAIFLAQIAYNGVRQGRKTHLTDMTTDDNRARYTALSNTLIGVILLVTGIFGLIAQTLGVPMVLALFSAMCALGALAATRLQEVQKRD